MKDPSLLIIKVLIPTSFRANEKETEQIHPRHWMIVGEFQPLNKDFCPIREKISESEIMRNLASSSSSRGRCEKKELFFLGKQRMCQCTESERYENFDIDVSFEAKPWQYSYEEQSCYRYVRDSMRYCFIVSVFAPSSTKSAKASQLQLLQRQQSSTFSLTPVPRRTNCGKWGSENKDLVALSSEDSGKFCLFSEAPTLTSQSLSSTERGDLSIENEETVLLSLMPCDEEEVNHNREEINAAPSTPRSDRVHVQIIPPTPVPQRKGSLFRRVSECSFDDNKFMQAESFEELFKTEALMKNNKPHGLAMVEPSIRLKRLRCGESEFNLQYSAVSFVTRTISLED